MDSKFNHVFFLTIIIFLFSSSIVCGQVTPEERQQVIQAVRELEDTVLDSVDINTDLVAQSYALLATAENLTSWWGELARLALDTIYAVVNTVFDISEFFKPDGGTEILEDGSKLSQVINGINYSRDPLGEIGTIAGLCGLFSDIDSYKIFFDSVSKIEEVARQDYALTQDYTSAKNGAWLELRTPSIFNGLLIPLKMGQPSVEGGRTRASRWLNGVKAVRGEIKKAFDDFILQLPDPLPSDYPINEVVAEMQRLRQNINATNFRVVKFRTLSNGKSIERHITLGMAWDGREVASLLFDAWRNNYDAQYSSTLCDTGETILQIGTYVIPPTGVIKEIAKGLSDLYEIKGLIQLPSDVVSLINKDVNPLDALQELMSKMNSDLVQEISNLWTFSVATTEYLQSIGKPIISENLTISPAQMQYVQNQTILGDFTLINEGIKSIAIKVLTIGGRDDNGEVLDFTHQTDVILEPNVPFRYHGSCILAKSGSYHFFTAYQDQDGNWHGDWDIPSTPGVTNSKDINVGTAFQPPNTVNDHASYVDDITIKDGTQMNPGQVFTKTWRIRNTGNTTWTPSYKFAFFSGSQMSGPQYISLSRNVPPNDIVDLSVTLTAPDSPGTYRGYWKMKNADGNFFDGWVYVEIVVPSAPPPPSYPSEGDLIRGDGTVWVYLFKDGKRWWIKNEDIFTKMGYQWASVKVIPWNVVSGIPAGPTIVDNGTLIKEDGDPKVYLIQNNQRRWITSPSAFTQNGYNWKDIIVVTQSIMSMYPVGTDITTPPNVLISSPNGGEKFLLGNPIGIVWNANDDASLSSISLYYSTNAGGSWNTIASGLANTGSYPWNPGFTSPTMKIKAVVYDNSGLSNEDASDGLFSIEDIYRFVDLSIGTISINPNSVTPGQQVTVNTTVRNLGNFASSPTNIKYYFSTTSSGRDNYLAQSNVPSIGAASSTIISQSVTIPQTTAPNAYIVAVINPDGIINEGTTWNNNGSSQIFMPDNTPPNIIWFALSGITPKTGWEFPLEFDIHDNIGVNSLAFHYSIDNQTTWNTITNYFIPGTNGCSKCYKWKIPASLPTPSTLWLKLKARDHSGNTSESITGPYQLLDGTKPSITLTSPNGGEVWDLGTTQNIRWNLNAPNGVSVIQIYLYFAGKRELLATLRNDPTEVYEWTLPLSSLYVTNEAKIRIYLADMNGNGNETWSTNYFVIRDASFPPPPPWTTPQVLTSVPSTNWPYTEKDHESPVLATDNLGNIHLLYKYIQDDISGIVNNTGHRVITQIIKYKKLQNSIWTEPVDIHTVIQNTDGNLTGFRNITDCQFAIGADGNPQVIWGETLSGGPTYANQQEIYFMRYDGTAWIAPINISNTIDTVSTQPRFAIDALGITHVIWRDGYHYNPDWTSTGERRIYYRNRNSSNQWSSVSELTTGNATWPSLAIDGNNNLHLAYLVDSESIAYIRWDGMNWSQPQTISTTADGHIKMVADSNNNLHTVWYHHDASTGKQKIFYRHFDGQSWSPLELVSDLISDDYFPDYPRIGMDSLNRPHVIFEEQTNGKIIYTYKDSGGWSVPIQLNLITEEIQSWNSDIIIGPNDEIYVVWVSAYNGHKEVFYNHANVEGVNDISVPLVSVNTPSGGDSLSIGSLVNIIWNARDNKGVSSINIEYTTDNGNTFIPIAANLENAGVYQWMIPNLSANNVQMRVSAQDVSGNIGYGLSGVFSVSDVTPPTVFIVSPNGGEAWEEGKQKLIEWTASDNVGTEQFDLYYSVDSGLIWQPIALGLAGSATNYLWTVPPQLSSGCRIQVISKDAAGNVCKDVSKNVFSITSSNKAPYFASPANPAEGASGVAVNTLVSWTGGDTDQGDSVTFDVYFGSGGVLSVVSEGQSGNTYNPGTLGYGQIYSWQIVSKDNHGNTSIGPIWSFVTESEAGPAIGASPINMSFQIILGIAGDPKAISVWNAESGNLDWAVSTDAPWLQFSPSGGTNSGSVAISVDASGLIAGTYNSEIRITSAAASNSPVVIPVTLIVSESLNPVLYTLTVTSSNMNRGEIVSITPDDTNGNSNGSPPFKRTYDANTAITLIAPQASGGKGFSHWNGCDSDSENICNITLISNRTVIAYYESTLAAGGYHSNLVRGDKSLWSWGWNRNGQLGDNTNVERNVPIPIGSSKDWFSVWAGAESTLALKLDGVLWGWGDSSTGQLGDGTNVSKSSPVSIQYPDFLSVSPGTYHTLGLKSDGSLWAWGQNNVGQIGDTTNVDKNYPVKIGSDQDWLSASAGQFHSLALKSDGTIWGWGSNFFGESGTGGTNNRPVQIGQDSDWVSVVAGGNFSMALKSDGTLWGWGWNGEGELGDGTNSNRLLPVKIGPDNDWISFSAGYSHTLALKVNGTMWAWGDNNFGQVGDETNIARNYPVQIGTANDWAQVLAGGYHSFALKSTGTLWTWGWNTYGQLGDGTNINKNAPILIAIPEYTGDFDRDGDVDGSDLADLILGNETMNIADFAFDFGRGN